MRRLLTTTLPFLIAGFLLVFGAACQGEDHAHGPETHTHDEEEAHEHGADTHTHDAGMAADTAGTYVDTTGAFFEGEPEEHEHGEDTHTHE